MTKIFSLFVLASSIYCSGANASSEFRYNADEGICINSMGTPGYNTTDDITLVDVQEKNLRPWNYQSDERMKVVSHIEAECVDFTSGSLPEALLVSKKPKFYAYRANLKGAKLSSFGKSWIELAELEGADLTNLNVVYFEMIGSADLFTKLSAITEKHCKAVKTESNIGFLPRLSYEKGDLYCSFTL